MTRSRSEFQLEKGLTPLFESPKSFSSEIHYLLALHARFLAGCVVAAIIASFGKMFNNETIHDVGSTRLSRHESCLPSSSSVPILLQPPPGRGCSRFPRSISLCPHQSPTPRPVAVSATVHQRRRHTEALDANQDRGEQLARHRHFGHLERHVLRMPNHFGPSHNGAQRTSNR